MQGPWYQNKTLWLCAIYLLIVGTIALRVNVEATHYTTPDSEYYMRVAENVVVGKGFVSPHPMDYPILEGAIEYPFTIWPVGYPVTISALMWPTGLGALTASKIVNLIFLAFIFLLLQYWFKDGAWLAGLYFLSYGKMEVFSYSWSESPFLFFELLLCYWMMQSLTVKKDTWLWAKLGFALLSLFLFRYAGLIFFFLAAGIMLYLVWHKHHQKGIHYFVGLSIASITALFYLYRNYQLSGFYSGMDRIQPEVESWGYFTLLLLKGLFNELMLARNYFFKGNLDLLFLGLFILQLVLAVWLCKWRTLYIHKTLLSKTSVILLACSATYLVGIVILRKIQPFDPFDFRILAPFSTPLFIALFSSLGLPENRAYYLKTVTWVVAFMGICWAMSLPKQFLMEQALAIFW